MTATTVLLFPGKILRSLITAAGYRPCFTQTGLDKDLDDQAEGKRQGSNFELFQHCQTAWLRAIRDDCGADWSNLVESGWRRHSDILVSLAQSTDTTGMIAEPARQALYRLLVIPELSGALQRASREIPLFDLSQWWARPFAKWLEYAAKQSNTCEETLLERLANHLEVDQRTLERWQQGEPIKKGLWPYRKATQAIFRGTDLSARQCDHFTGWLAVAVAIQSVPGAWRDDLECDFRQHRQRPLQAVTQAISQLKREAADRNSLPLRNQVAPVLADLDSLFSNARDNQQGIRDRLAWLRALYERNGPSARDAHEYLWLWLSARLAANLLDQDNALKLYAAACEKAWWRAGSNQYAILQEALCYAVGVGAKILANHCWEKCFLLGLNAPPKRELDLQNMRLLSIKFEHQFAPQNAKQQVPPPVQEVVSNEPFALSKKELAHPDRITAYVDGKVRYTPLMRAVLFGTLADVKQAVNAGADPNRVIPESGEHALIMALRRADDRKDSEILHYLLTLAITPATANQAASTKRETPLHIAANMADATVVARLIELGADIEQPCFTSPSALVYAMALLHESIHPEDPAPLNAYLQGRVPADAFDAKAGAVLDCELSAKRQRSMSLLQLPAMKRIFEAVVAEVRGPPSARRQVIMTLLANKADPNRRYDDFNGHKDRWTPTLFAAQLGDLDLLKAMINAGGNPWLCLDDESPLNEKNALWVALAYKRQTVVEFLQTQLPRHSGS